MSVIVYDQFSVYKKAPAIAKAFFWCTIGDSNPGPTD